MAALTARGFNALILSGSVGGEGVTPDLTDVSGYPALWG
jgi:hypothetical protein